MTTATDTTPIIEFRRVAAGHYETVGIEPTYSVKREATDWNVYRSDKERRVSRRATCSEAQQWVRATIRREMSR